MKYLCVDIYNLRKVILPKFVSFGIHLNSPHDDFFVFGNVQKKFDKSRKSFSKKSRKTIRKCLKFQLNQRKFPPVKSLKCHN